MIVVSDTSTLNYLVLVEADQFLPDLFGQFAAPPAVLTENRRLTAYAVNGSRPVVTSRHMAYALNTQPVAA